MDQHQHQHQNQQQPKVEEFNKGDRRVMEAAAILESHANKQEGQAMTGQGQGSSSSSNTNTCSSLGGGGGQYQAQPANPHQQKQPSPSTTTMTVNDLLLEAFKTTNTSSKNTATAAPVVSAAITTPDVTGTAAATAVDASATVVQKQSDDLVAKLLAANKRRDSSSSSSSHDLLLETAKAKNNLQNNLTTQLSTDNLSLVANLIASTQSAATPNATTVNNILLEALKSKGLTQQLSTNLLAPVAAVEATATPAATTPAPNSTSTADNLVARLLAAQSMVAPPTPPTPTPLNTAMLLDAMKMNNQNWTQLGASLQAAPATAAIQPISTDALMAKLLAHSKSLQNSNNKEEGAGTKTHSLADIMSEAMPVANLKANGVHWDNNSHNQTSAVLRQDSLTSAPAVGGGLGRVPLPAKKARRGPLSRSSAYRGVTFYRRTTRWEAHVWTNGKQQYLGGYKEEEAAARAYDKAVIKIRGKEGDTNFPSSEYVDEMKRLRADELTVDEFILVLRDEAKKRSKQLKEEEEDRRIAMLKQLNEGGRSDALNEYLDMNRQQVPSSSTITGKRERGAGDVLSTLAAVSQGLVVGSKHQQQMNAEAILDSYLEMTRKAKRQKREQEKVALASHQSHHASMLASLLQSHGHGGGGGGGGGASASTGTSPITPSLSLGGVDPQQLMAQMLNAESLLVGQQQNSLVLQALAQQQQRLEHQQLEQRARSMTSLSLIQQHQEKPLHPPPQLTTTTTTAGAAAATTTSSKMIPLDQSSGDALRNLLSRPPTAQITHTLSNVSKATIASITPPSSDAGSLTVSNHSDSG